MTKAAIYRGPTKGYSLTDSDVLWLARAFVGEAGKDVTEREASALFYCWMDRFLLVNAKWLQSGWSFEQLLRAHSQPINPKWIDPSDTLCQKYPNQCTPSAIARRQYISTLSIDKLKKMGVWNYAIKAQQGDLERVIEEPTYDFAACSLTAKQNRPNKGINIGGNCFLVYSSLKASEKKQVLEGHVEVTKVTGERILSAGVILWAMIVGYSIYRLLK